MNKKYNLYFIATSIMLAASFSLASCSKEDGGIEALTIKEANYVSGENYMGISLKDNETLQLTPFVMPGNMEAPPVVYEHRHPEIMTISAGGLITPVAPGRDTLTVSTTGESKLSVSYVVNIIDHDVKATGITVTASGRNMLLRPGETFNLAEQVSLTPADTWNKAVTYASADETIVTVTSAGLVTAVAEGKTVVRITTADGSNITTECNATVEAMKPVDIVRIR